MAFPVWLHDRPCLSEDTDPSSLRFILGGHWNIRSHTSTRTGDSGLHMNRTANMALSIG